MMEDVTLIVVYLIPDYIIYPLQ